MVVVGRTIAGGRVVSHAEKEVRNKGNKMREERQREGEQHRERRDFDKEGLGKRGPKLKYKMYLM